MGDAAVRSSRRHLLPPRANRHLPMRRRLQGVAARHQLSSPMLGASGLAPTTFFLPPPPLLSLSSPPRQAAHRTSARGPAGHRQPGMALISSGRLGSLPLSPPLAVPSPSPCLLRPLHRCHCRGPPIAPTPMRRHQSPDTFDGCTSYLEPCPPPLKTPAVENTLL